MLTVPLEWMCGLSKIARGSHLYTRKADLYRFAGAKDLLEKRSARCCVIFRPKLTAISPGPGHATSDNGTSVDR